MKFGMKLSLLPIAIALIFFSGCYRMPSEDDYSVIPTTNNPTITREKNTLIPNMPY